VNKIKINTWEQAFRLNFEPQTRVYDTHEWSESFSPNFKNEFQAVLQAKTQKRRIDALVDFVLRQQLSRWQRGCADGFKELANLRFEGNLAPLLYLGRDPNGYFYRKYTSMFSGIIGLDVGCQLFEESKHNFAIPHYEYYRKLGAKRMIGIDMLLKEANEKEDVYPTDVRNMDTPALLQEKGIAHFATVAKIFGKTSPSNTVLEIAGGLSELQRVLRLDGLIFVADSRIDTALVYIAQKLGFKVFHNTIRTATLLNLPLGYFIVHANCPVDQNHFSEVLSILGENQLEILPY